LLDSDGPRQDLPGSAQQKVAVCPVAFGDDLEEQFETAAESYWLRASRNAYGANAPAGAGTSLRGWGQIRDGS